MSIRVNNQLHFCLVIMVKEALLRKKKQFLIIQYFHG